MEFMGSPNAFAGRIERMRTAERTWRSPGSRQCARATREVRRDGRWRDGAGASRVCPPVRGAARRTGRPLSGRITKIADLGFVSHCFVRLADGHEALAYRLNGAESGTTDPLEEGQLSTVVERTGRPGICTGTETQTAGPSSNGPDATRRRHA